MVTLTTDDFNELLFVVQQLNRDPIIWNQFRNRKEDEEQEVDFTQYLKLEMKLEALIKSGQEFSLDESQ